MFLARRSALFFAAALLSAIFFSMTASSSLVKGRNVGRLLSESFSAPPPMSDMVQLAGWPRTADYEAGSGDGDERERRCQKRRRRRRHRRGRWKPPWLQPPAAATAIHSLALACACACTWSGVELRNVSRSLFPPI